MRLRFLDAPLPQMAYRTLILTSETGVEAAVRLRDAGNVLPDRAICVGDRTAAAAREAGMDAQSAQGDAEALIELVMSAEDTGPYLHLRGREARGDIAPRLAARGRTAESVIVYEQVSEKLTEEAMDTLSGDDPVLIPLFSPRSSLLLAQQGHFQAPLFVIAMSPAVAAAALDLAPARVEVAARTDSLAVLDAIARFISEPAS